ncbi:hypothetical protein VN12_09215 [Pirellula sp. SH-Sr6A]|nr:hypothetical protein VN12_09215 [Pirellula sp. SH-Sr6A]
MPPIANRSGLYFYLLTIGICLTGFVPNGLAQPPSPPLIGKSRLLYWADDANQLYQLPAKVETGPHEQWTLSDGTELRGSIALYADLDGDLITFVDGKRVIDRVPIDRFAEQSRARAEGQIQKRRELVQRLRDLVPVALDLGPQLHPALLGFLNFEDGHIRFWYMKGIFEAPESEFQPDQLRALQESWKRRDSMPAWKCVGEPYPFASRLLGITPLGYAMQGLIQNNVAVEEIEFIVPHGLFVAASRISAESIAKNSPRNDRWLDSPFPKWVYGVMQPGRVLMSMPVLKGNRVDWESTKWLEPKLHTQIGQIQRQTILAAMTPQALTLTSRMVKESVEKNWSVRQVLEHWTDDKITSEEARWIGNMPAKQMQLCNQWRLQGLTLARNQFEGVLLHTQENLWHFRNNESMEVFSVPKEVIDPEYHELGEHVTKRIRKFLETHPDPNYPKPNPYRRLIRNISAGGATPYTKPIDVPAASKTPLESIEVEASNGRGNIEKVAVRRYHTHPDDWAFLVGVASAPSQRAGTVTSEIQMVLYEKPRDKRKFSYAFPVQGIRRFAFGYLIQKDDKWVMVDEAMVAKPQGDSLEIAIGRTEARLQEEEKYRKTPSTLGYEYVLYGVFNGNVVIGKNAVLESTGKLRYTDINNQNVSLPQHLTVIERGEFLLQVELLKLLKGKSESELTEVKPVRPEVRLSLYRDIEKKIADHWPIQVKYRSGHYFDAHFEAMDDDDAIFKRISDDRYFRVSVQRLLEDDVKELIRLDALRKNGETSYSKRKLDAASVTDRMIRLYSSDYPRIIVNPEIHADSIRIRVSDDDIYYIPTPIVMADDIADLRNQIAKRNSPTNAASKLDAALTAQVQPSETRQPLRTIPPRWKQKVDSVVQRSDKNWVKSSFDWTTPPDVSIFSHNGAYLLTNSKGTTSTAGWFLTRFEGDAKPVTLPIALECSSTGRVFWNRDCSQLFVLDDGKLVRLRVQISPDNARWEVSDSTLLSDQISPLILSGQSSDGNRVFLFCESGELCVVDLDTNRIASQKIQNPPIRTTDRNRFGCWPSKNGDAVAIKIVNDVDVYYCDSKTLRFSLSSSTQIDASEMPGILMDDMVIYAEPDARALRAVPAKRPRDVEVFAINIPLPFVPRHLAITRSEGGQLGDFVVFGTPTNQEVSEANPMMSTPMTFVSTHPFLPQRVCTSGEVKAFSGDGRRILHAERNRFSLMMAPETRRLDYGEFDDLAKELIEEQKFVELDSIWNYLQTDALRKQGSFPTKLADRFLRAVYFSCLEYKQEVPGDAGERFNKYVVRWMKMMPESILPRMLECQRLRDRAWMARGTGTINTVTEEGAAFYQQSMRTLVQKIRDLLPLETCSVSYYLAFDACMALGLPPTSSDALQGAFTRSDSYESPDPHRIAVLSLLPRWFGEPGDSEKYIEQVSDNLGGKEGDEMYAVLILDAMNYDTSELPMAKVLQCDLDRMLQGMKEMDDETLSLYLLRGLNGLFWSERKLEAKELWLHATRRGVLPHVSTLSVIEKLPLMLEAMGLNDSHHRVPIRERR